MALEPTSRFGGFLFADLRGYTAFVESRGDNEAVRLLERYRAIVREVVADAAGAEIRTEGDSFYVVFPSASRAVTAGLAIVAEAARRSAADPDYPISVGVGVHAGETADTEEGPVGSAVNLAARICAEAPAGQVLVSDTVRGLTRTAGGFVFESVGTRRLKGIDEPVTLYRARAPGDVPAPAPVLPPRRRGRLVLVLGGVVLVAGVAVAIGLFMSGPAAGAGRIVFSLQTSLPGGGGCGGGDGIDAKLYQLDPVDLEIEPHRLTSGTDGFEPYASWSADGAVLAFPVFAPRKQPVVYALSAANETRSVVAEDVNPLHIGGSADGQSLAWPDEETGGVVIAAVDGSGTELVPKPDASPEEQFWAVDVDFLPDGRLLVLSVSARETGNLYRVETVTADGSEREAVPLDLAGDYGEVVAAPDGERFLLSVFAEEGVAWHLIAIADSSDEVLDLPENVGSAAWSPDGERLVVSAGPLPFPQLHEVDLGSGETRQLTSFESASACSPIWGPATGTFAEPIPTPLPPDALRTFEFGALPAGRYAVTTFQPNMEIDFPEGWYARRNWVDGWSVKHVDYQGSELDAGRIQVGLSGPCGTEGQFIIGTGPQEVVNWLNSRADLEVSAPSAINLGGFTGIQVDVTGLEGAHCPDSPDDPFWQLFFLGEDAAGLGDGELVRIAAIDVRGLTVAFMTFSFPDEFDDFVVKTQPVMESFVFP